MSRSRSLIEVRIGEVSRRTGVPTRMIRYYELCDLLEPRRGSNGYREYDEDDLARVQQVRDHIAAGLPTRLVKIILDMAGPAWSERCSQQFADQLADELAALDARMACLAASRQTLAEQLDRLVPGPSS